MQKLTFFKGLIIGLSISTCLWAGIFMSVKKLIPSKTMPEAITDSPESIATLAYIHPAIRP